MQRRWCTRLQSGGQHCRVFPTIDRADPVGSHAAVGLGVFQATDCHAQGGDNGDGRQRSKQGRSGRCGVRRFVTREAAIRASPLAKPIRKGHAWRLAQGEKWRFPGESGKSHSAGRFFVMPKINTTVDVPQHAGTPQNQTSCAAAPGEPPTSVSGVDNIRSRIRTPLTHVRGSPWIVYRSLLTVQGWNLVKDLNGGAPVCAPGRTGRTAEPWANGTSVGSCEIHDSNGAKFLSAPQRQGRIELVSSRLFNLYSVP